MSPSDYLSWYLTRYLLFDGCRSGWRLARVDFWISNWHFFDHLAPGWGLKRLKCLAETSYSSVFDWQLVWHLRLLLSRSTAGAIERFHHMKSLDQWLPDVLSSVSCRVSPSPLAPAATGRCCFSANSAAPSYFFFSVCVLSFDLTRANSN